jgi:hypothetical protein
MLVRAVGAAVDGVVAAAQWACTCPLDGRFYSVAFVAVAGAAATLYFAARGVRAVVRGH